MDKTFDHKNYEEKIYNLWEKSDSFKASKGEPYTILMPPPNANASLHAGHGMYVIDDILVRWKRMQGFSAVWIPGMDHAGFETQYVYEKELSKKGQSRMDFDRQTLYENIFNFVKDNSGLIYKQFRRLGFSADWDRSVFTLDEKVLKRVYKTFEKMAKESLVYRDNYLVNFCPNCGTSLAELEVKHEDRVDPLYFIKYPLSGREGEFITVATVRPETIFGDTAIAVNPKDKRYKTYIGLNAKLPLINREVPIIADNYVDMDFGSGALKITPAHDPNDYEIGKKYKLESISVIDWSGRMKMPNGFTYPEIEGKKPKAARELVVNRLTEEGFIDKVQDDYTHSVTICYKCHKDLEPLIVPNWFIKVDDLKKHASDAVKDNKVNFYPKKYKKHILDWFEIMHDWPISRQIVWGIKIPVWYEIDLNKDNIWVWWLNPEHKLMQGSVREFLRDGITLSEIEKGLQKVQAETGTNAPEYVVSEKKPNDGMFIPETDTFDTWFSSGQWPLVTLNEEEFATRFPTDILGTLSDILKFWVSRMIMFSLYETGKVPFRDVYLWSMVADSKGIKMSKSKGNVINPIELVDKYGADALRMSLIYGTPAGSKVILSEDKVRGMRNFSNKIWNIARYVFSDIPQSSSENNSKKVQIHEDDEWIIKELNKTITKVTQSLEKYQLNEAAEVVYDFVWHTFADQYIEKSKTRRVEAQETLVYVLVNSLKLLHPFMPFVTEAIWSFGLELKLQAFDSPHLITSLWPNKA